MEKFTYTSIDQYIQGFEGIHKKRLEEIRAIIRKALPKAQEVISYNMPAYKQNKVLVYFAASKNHIGFYPTGSGIAAFEHEFAGYTYSKGALQLPLDKALPKDLITRICLYRKEMDTIKKSK